MNEEKNVLKPINQAVLGKGNIEIKGHTKKYIANQDTLDSKLKELIDEPEIKAKLEEYSKIENDIRGYLEEKVVPELGEISPEDHRSIASFLLGYLTA